MKQTTHKVWKTITLGKKPNLEGINVSSYAKSMLDTIPFQKEKEKIDLVNITVGELGFDRSATLSEIYTRAEELGLELCPPEVGPILRDEYEDQPMNDWVYVGMKPISDTDGRPLVFRVGRLDDGLWLNDSWADPTRQWHSQDAFLFRLRKLGKLCKKKVSTFDTFDISDPSDSCNSDPLNLEERIKLLEKFKTKVEKVLNLD